MLSEKALHEAESWVWNKVHKEKFQLHSDWYDFTASDGTCYEINVYTDFYTNKTGATIYPLGKANTDHGVRIL